MRWTVDVVLSVAAAAAAFFILSTFVEDATADTYIAAQIQQGVSTRGNWEGEHPTAYGLFVHHDISDRWAVRAGWDHKSNADRGCNFYAGHCRWAVDGRPETWVEEVYIRLEARLFTLN